MEESDVLLVKRYMDECLFEPNPKLDREAFDIQSYSGWAVGEILCIVSEELMRPPPCVTGRCSRDLIDIIEEFAFDMEMCSEQSTDPRFRDMFAIARDAADDVLYFCIHERGKNNE